MKILSERVKEIDAYLENHPEAEQGKWPIEIHGEKNIVSFYRFPIELLRYNKNNGRLAMDVKDWEKQNERRLNAHDKADAEVIRNMLLKLDEKKTEVLRDDLRKKGQMEPGVITYDGFVINGNRRMAILEEFHKEEPTGKWQFLEAVRLPVEITEKDLWRIEAGLQLSKDKVAEYHAVNELLKIKQGVDTGLNPSEIAAAMYGWTVEEIKEALERLTLIENFLSFMNQPGNYGLIKKFGYSEYFIDIQKNVINPAKRIGLRRSDLARRLGYVFALLRANINRKPNVRQKRITHWDIRKFGKIFSDAHAEAAYLKNLAGAKDLRDVPPEKLVDDFQNAVEELDLKDQRDQPVKLIEKAIKALERIDRESKHFREKRVKIAMDKLAEVVHKIYVDYRKQYTST